MKESSMDQDHPYKKVLHYLDNNPIAVLGTTNPDGTPHGSAIYTCADDYEQVVYFLTKNGTQKYRNLTDRPGVSLTVVNPAENSTLQASGEAFIVRDASVIDSVMKKINRTHALAHAWLPPIAKLHAGAYVIVGVRIQHARLAQYDNITIGDEHIFTQAS